MIPKRVGASTQPCFTPLPMSSKGSETLLLNCTDPFVLEWKGSVKLCSLGGQPIFRSALKRPSLLTRSKALVRSMNATKQGHLLLSALLLELSEGEHHVHSRPFSSEATLWF